MNAATTSAERTARAFRPQRLHLENGERTDRLTFHAWYEATPDGFKAELIGGEVVVASPLQDSHADAHAAVLRIRESKFHKSRWVPLSDSARRELRQYLKVRHTTPYGTCPSAPLLYNGLGTLDCYTSQGLYNAIARLCKAANIRNVRVLRMESSYVVRYLLPPRSVETFYLLFPDPWPKRRHWRRRIVTPDLLKAISQALVQGGTLLIATDHLSYFEKIKEIAQANLDLAIVDPANVDLPQSRFARVFQQKGVAIHWLELRKVSPVR